MFERSRLMFLYSVTPVHMGTGQAIGVIDNPIQREHHTHHPNMAGSGLKGAIRHRYSKWDPDKVNRLFGPEQNASDYAGAVSFGDAQLVAFPVRSLKQAFVYAVSPISLARLKRLATLTGIPVDWNPPSVEGDKAVVTDKRVLHENKLVLEVFEYDAPESENLKVIADWLADHALPQSDEHQPFREKIRSDLVLLPDAAFSHFVENATVVEPHVRINDETGTADGGGLFYTENLPPETLLTAPVFASAERYKKKPENPLTADDIMKEITGKLNGKLIQVGGDATTGRGQVILHFAQSGKQEKKA
ncbi:MAG: type III-B CRISPR module RAMP protein Cmr4 [Methylothermaceae bacterium]|nr:type III-B CRISPR module RAMP protein Cmr4 [Methylothermaceae bacterium]